MVVVLIILAILIGFLIWGILILFSDIKIEIKQLEFSNVLYPHMVYDFTVCIGFYFMNTIKLLRFTVNKAKLERSKLVNKISIKEVEKNVKINKELWEHLKTIKPKLQALKLNASIGTEDAVLTSITTLVLATLLSILLPYVVEPKHQPQITYKIEPLYQGKNIIDFSLHCIIYVKMVHIMNIIYIYLRKRRVEKYERTSNRRTYANSYE